MNIQFKKGVLELCMFSLLIKKDYYAYELIKALTSSFIIQESALYPLLRNLTLEGYLETYFNEDHSKKYYRLTQKGLDAHKEYLQEWEDLTQRVNKIVKEDMGHE